MTRHYLDILAEVIRDNWDCPALTDYSLLQGEGGNEYTYGQMYEKIQELCQLFTQLGLRPGDHIALCGANSANWAVAYLAIAAFRGVSVTILHTLSPSEIVQLINFADSKAVFVDSETWKSINELCLNAEQVISLEDFSIIQGTPYQGNECSFKPFDLTVVSLDDLAQICFTSGTTSKPKGVMIPYRSINANISFGYDIFKKYGGRNTIAVLPSAHIYGLVLEIIQPLCLGTHIHIVSDELSIPLYKEVLSKIRPIIAMVVPLILEILLKNNKRCSSPVKEIIIDYFGNQIDLIGIGGAGLSMEIEDTLIKSNIPIAICYGMTECAPRVAVSLYSQLRRGSVGKFVPTLEGCISPEGEILVRGENVMLGYYKDEQATREKIDADGWLHTGDRGHLDEDGYLYVEGRLNQDMIVLPSGENIHPENIESIINAVPHVIESLILAREEKLVAMVRKDAAVSPAQAIAERNAILAMVNPQLPSFSQLFGIEFFTTPLARTEKQTIKRYMYH